MDINVILDEKQPPPGGIYHLRRRIDQKQKRRRKQFWALGFAGVALSLVLAFPLLNPQQDERPAFVWEALENTENPVVADAAAVKMLESDSVVFYRVIHIDP